MRGTHRLTISRQSSQTKVRWGRDFARSVTIVACVGLALLVSGCDTTDSRYFRYGIGTDLYSEDIVQATQYQDIYLTELCRQALPVLSTSDGPCLNASLGPNDWNLLVQAGLNDVDRRCDSYLAWLDDRRRTNNAVLKELGDVTVASQAIMRVAGVSANPITLAGLAFGLAANTFTNINSRLLLEVDKTTVQTLVLRRRSDFRGELQSIRIGNKPAAVHALRSYLNICTPFAIETDINSTITVFQTGGAAALAGPPLISAETVRSTTIQSAREPLPKTDFSEVRTTRLPKAFVTNVQTALCVPDKTGTADAPTVQAIRDYLLAARKPVPDTIDPTSAALRPLLQTAIDDVGSCTDAGFKNAFEVGRFGVNANTREARIKGLQKKMAAFLTLNNSTVVVTPTGTFDAQTRTAIRAIRKLNNATDSDQLDSDTVRKILAAS